MLKHPDDLIIPAAGGMRISHYKVQDCDVWFRSIGVTYTGTWRKLTELDVLMHLVLKTEVAEWLYERRGFTMGTLKRAS